MLPIPPFTKIEANETTVFEFGIVLMAEISESRLNVIDITKKPVHDIDKVRELSEQGTTVESKVAFPRNFAVVVVITVPEAIDLHHVDTSQNA